MVADSVAAPGQALRAQAARAVAQVVPQLQPAWRPMLPQHVLLAVARRQRDVPASH